jgi:hypothetical protein
VEVVYGFCHFRVVKIVVKNDSRARLQQPHAFFFFRQPALLECIAFFFLRQPALCVCIRIYINMYEYIYVYARMHACV